MPTPESPPPAAAARSTPGDAAPRRETPMMEQWWRAKDEAPGALLFFRMGDFYELFGEDAVVASRELGITLTKRDKGPDALPMAGVPVRSVEGYLLRLVRKGFRVAICEQLTDPRQAKGIVERGIVRVVTAGTLTEEDALDARASNFLLALARSGPRIGASWVDLSTGRLLAAERPLANLLDLLVEVEPAEVLLCPEQFQDQPELLAELERQFGPRLTEREGWRFDRGAALRACRRQFGVQTLAGFGLEDDQAAVPAVGVLLEYLGETQKNACAHVRRIELAENGRHLVLDRTTRSCLELVETQRGARREGSLLDVLDATATPMGGRLLREWLLYPLVDPDPILARQAAVAEWVADPSSREALREALAGMRDLERLCAKLSTGRVNGRDLLALAQSAALVPQLIAVLAGAGAARLLSLRAQLDPLTDLTERVRRTLVPEPPLTVREGGLIASGFDAELDELRQIAGDGKGWMARFQAEESQRSGIPNLKIGFNSVFGYYLEVPHGQVERVPDHFIRRQTVKGGERYITPELKEYETKVLKAEELSRDLEYRLFDELRIWLAGLVGRVLDTARAVAELDVLAALAQLAAERRYVAPAVDRSAEIWVREGRHPVIERSSAIERFVPNDTALGGPGGKIAILTGPNMAGKSTYIRQTALIVLLAQIGSFVPADEARIGVVDRIFTRVGSGDDISRGESTFMVEMVEIANILNNAGARSLVVLDEVGRGTSTFDGLALAWAIVEHIRDRIGARTLFATHYHQLTQLADRERGVLNLSVAVEERGDEILFLHKIVPGGTDRSYGIHVARLAGVPREVVARARKVLEKIERESEHLAPALAQGKLPAAQQLDLFSERESPVERRLREIDLDRLSPLEALLELKRLKDSLSG